MRSLKIVFIEVVIKINLKVFHRAINLLSKCHIVELFLNAFPKLSSYLLKTVENYEGAGTLVFGLYDFVVWEPKYK